MLSLLILNELYKMNAAYCNITYVQSNHYKMCNVHCVFTGKSQNRQGMIKYKACHIVNTRAVTFIIIVQFKVFKASIIYPRE